MPMTNWMKALDEKENKCSECPATSKSALRFKWVSKPYGATATQNINCKSQDRPFLGHTCMVMWVKSPKLCIIIKFHYNRLFERLNNVEKIRTAQRRNAKTKRTRYTAIHAMPPLSGLLFYFPPSFYTVMGTERSRRATKCIGPGPIPIPPSQRKPPVISVFCRWSWFNDR